jgi:ferredoxin
LTAIIGGLKIKSVTFAKISKAVAPVGMICCAGFYPLPEDGIDPPAGTVVLVGNAGPAMWRVFAARVPKSARDRDRDPLDGWTRRVLTEVALQLGARVLFPFEGPPFHPFMRWAKRAEPIAQAPIGPLIHLRYGLWRAYRAAFVLRDAIELPPAETAPSPCAGCSDRPCTTGCPVDAIRRDAYDVPRCVEHVLSEAGAGCLARGCRARRACPVGVSYRHEPEQAAFHMRKFIAAHSRAPKSLAGS